MNTRYSIGLDFGTESVRAVLVDTSSGETAGTSVVSYAHGVIDEFLPGSDDRLPPAWALQDADDWLQSMQETVRNVLTASGVSPESVAGIGIDFTSCTVLPTDAEGRPLHTREAYRDQPHAWVKLWKHHGAQPQADRVSDLARARGEPWLPRYGGIISSEWLLPKALQILEEAPDVYGAAACILEGGDWIAWQLTGVLTRNACSAGYKGLWHKDEGYPTPSYLAALHPDLANLYEEKVAGPVVPPGSNVGTLRPEWADRLGLTTETAVAAAIIDAHAGAPGSGVSQAGTLFMAMGTSTCHILMSEREEKVAGISGVVADGVLPGLYGYEAGQAGVGDIFGWFVEHCVPPSYHREAEERGRSLHGLLSEKASRLAPGESGLLALDWWNGCRTPLVAADLSGLLLGCTLRTRAEEIYRALIEATAFGTRMIIELFNSEGVAVDAVRVGGGLTQNDLLLQIYADVTGFTLSVSGSEQAAALGAAMLGAAAGGCVASVSDAARTLAPPPSCVVDPIPEHRAVYDELYDLYRQMVDDFGRNPDSPLRRLHRLRRRASQ